MHGTSPSDTGRSRLIQETFAQVVERDADALMADSLRLAIR